MGIMKRTFSRYKVTLNTHHTETGIEHDYLVIQDTDAEPYEDMVLILFFKTVEDMNLFKLTNDVSDWARLLVGRVNLDTLTLEDIKGYYVT